jgi:leucyl aminopeptidase (aminopeptidase T)
MDRIAWVRGAKVLVDDSLGVRAGENVLIVGDTGTARVAELLALVAAERGAKVTVCLMEPTGLHGGEPPAPVAAAMKAADSVLVPTSHSMFHTSARRAAAAAGARVVIIPGGTESLFAGGSLDIDIHQIGETVARVGRTLREARTLRITSDEGTDIRMELAGRPSVDQPGFCLEAGASTAFPMIETAVAPLEGSAEGRLVVDGAVPQAGLIPVAEPVVFTFFKGVVTEISGGRDAPMVRDYLEGFKDPGVYTLVEVGVGLNPRAKLERSYAESESQYGTIHFGIGDGISFGVSHRAVAHVDLVVRNPVLELDGRIVLRDHTLIID